MAGLVKVPRTRQRITRTYRFLAIIGLMLCVLAFRTSPQQSTVWFQRRLRNGMKKNVLYFVVSHPSCVELETTARETWAKDIDVLWFSTESTFADSIIVTAEPNTYDNIFARVLKVWAEVYSRHRLKYDWYVRLSPDNYVFKDRLEALLLEYDSDLPHMLGRVGENQRGERFVGGGAGWAMSWNALELWNAHDGAGFQGCQKPGWLDPGLEFAEDVIISNCLTAAGVNFIQRSDVFLSHPPHHPDNGDLTDEKAAMGVPTQIVTLHYMKTAQMVNVWRKERARQYAVISIAVKSGIDPYLFILPFTVAAWKRIGWSTIIIATGSKLELENFSTVLGNVVFGIDPRVAILPIESTEQQQVTVSQISRLFVASQAWISDNDVLLTSDVDLLPISPELYDLASRRETITVLNGDCCGLTRVNGNEILMQPMSHVGATRRNWFELMKLSEGDLSVDYINNWLNSANLNTIPTEKVIKAENEHWYLDQRILSLQLALTNMSVTKVSRDTLKDRVDRAYTETWPSILTNTEILSKTDLHAWLPAYDSGYWSEMDKIISVMFDAHDAHLLREFKEKYTSLE